MTIPESVWIKYINLLAAIDRTAAKKLTAYLNMHDVSGKQGRKSAIDYAYGITTKYGESSAAVACEMYDAVAAASGVNVPAAEPAPTPDYGEVAKAYNGMVKQGLGNDAIGDGISRLVRRTGADTTRNNALRDGAEFAWVPHGDTCSFCIMLASNGWQKASKKTISGDHADHIHPNCDCTFAIRFDGKSGVRGYDPDKYREMYDNADGNTWKEKLNSMRRDEYAKNGDKIRAQKREAYARRKALKDERASGKIANGREDWVSPIPEAKEKLQQGFEAFPIGDKIKGNAKRISPDGNKFDVAMHGTPVGVGFGTENPSLTARELARIISRDPAYHGQTVRLLACHTGAALGNGEYCFAEELANALGCIVEAPDDYLYITANGDWYVKYPGNKNLVVFKPNQRRRLK